MKVKSLSCVWLLATPWTAAYQAPLSMGFSRQEYQSGLPLPSPWQTLFNLNSNSRYSELTPWLWASYTHQKRFQPWNQQCLLSFIQNDLYNLPLSSFKLLFCPHNFMFSFWRTNSAKLTSCAAVRKLFVDIFFFLSTACCIGIVEMLLLSFHRIHIWVGFVSSRNLEFSELE